METEADLAKAAIAGASSQRPPVADVRSSLSVLEAVARAELVDAKAEVAAAESALKSGMELKQTLDEAGGQVVTAIARITDEVDAIVVETQRDPESLATLIAGLGTMYGKLTTVPEALAPRDAKPAVPGPPRRKGGIPWGHPTRTGKRWRA